MENQQRIVFRRQAGTRIPSGGLLSLHLVNDSCAIYSITGEDERHWKEGSSGRREIIYK